MPALASPQLWGWIAIALAAGLLVWLLSPILAPFLFAGILAYIFDPIVGLRHWRHAYVAESLYGGK
jgi:predicted PurR-regulated permease PerM